MRSTHLSQRLQRRAERGASIILVSVCAVLLILLIYVGFNYALITGGSREVRNAVDAGALNVSKRVVELKVPPNDVYKDVADSAGGIGLSNINRVWGKAVIINANVQGMKNEGSSTPDAESNALMSYQGAQNINDQLYGALQSKSTLDNYFNQLANNRPASLLGAEATISAPERHNWTNSMVYRGDESNISFDKQQLPAGVTLSEVQRGKKLYIKGYSPFTVNNRTFCMTTFRIGEMPHLISDNFFDANQQQIAGVTNPIPNAFRASGAVSTPRASLAAAASAVANPQRQFDMAIPYAFVSLQFGNTAKWYVEGKKVKETAYGFAPETQWEVKNHPLSTGGFLNGYASLGNEYKVTNVWQAFNALPGNHKAALQKMLQRIQEIKPKYSMDQLRELLEKQSFNPNTNKYFIYPVYKTPDRTDPDIQMTGNNGTLPPWLNGQNPADGLDGAVAEEEKQKNEPNYNWQTIMGGNPYGKHWTEVSGKILWKPGTGYGQCLGELRIARLTEAYFTGSP